jgi:hypothetical protein
VSRYAGLAGSGAVLAVALAASALVAWALPLAPDDPFRGTLVLLPVILGGLREIHRWGVRLGGWPLGAAAATAELGALAALILLVLARPDLGIAGIDEILAAGLLLVLGIRVGRQVLSLRPLLGERLPRRPSLLFLLLPFAVYLAVLPWSARQRQPDGDEPFYLLVTHSLAYDFDADLTNNYAHGDWRHFMDRPIEPQPGDPVGAHGERYSRHNELLPLMLAPAYRVAGKMGALATMALMTAALAWLTLRLARHYFPDRPGEALAAWALVAFAPPLLLYSGQVWVEVPAALLTMVALDRILSMAGAPAAAGRRWGRAEWLGLVVPVLLLPLLKIRLVLLSGPLVLLGWWYAGRSRRQLMLLVGLLGGLAAGMLLYNQLVYSNPLKIHTWAEVDPMSYGPASYVHGLSGLFFDAAFGLFASAPIWMVLLPAFLLLAARRSPLLVHMVVLSLPYLMVVVPRIEWYGGWSPPFRYALIAMPLLGIALVPLMAGVRERPGVRMRLAILAGLAALTVALTLVWVVVPGWTYNFADGRTLALDALSGRLGLDMARFFPSSVRPRAATWIWPLAAIPLVPLLWWLPGARPKEPGEKRFPSHAPLAGVALMLAAAALLPAVAAHVPTRVVEMEDPQVRKSGGHLHPDPWVIERTRYRGGWVLRVGERLEAPVASGGRRVKLRLFAEFIRNQPAPFTLDVKQGDRLLASWTPGRARIWETVDVGPVDWQAGEPLVLVAHGPAPPGALNGAILDRVEMEWR